MLKPIIKDFYVMGKAMSAELFCTLMDVVLQIIRVICSFS